MDYGQPKQSAQDTSEKLFDSGITEGEGVAPENVNPSASESLHSDDQSISWDNIISKNHNVGGIGNFAMTAKGNSANQSPELGQIVNLEPEPARAASRKTSPVDQALSVGATINIDDAVVEHDAISKKTLDDITHGIKKFDKDELTAVQLVELRENAMRALLKNSYGRDLAA